MHANCEFAKEIKALAERQALFPLQPDRADTKNKLVGCFFRSLARSLARPPASQPLDSLARQTLSIAALLIRFGRQPRQERARANERKLLCREETAEVLLALK